MGVPPYLWQSFHITLSSPVNVVAQIPLKGLGFGSNRAKSADTESGTMFVGIHRYNDVVRCTFYKD